MDTSKLAMSIYELLTAKLAPIERVLNEEKQVEMDGILSGAAQEIAELSVEAVGAILKNQEGNGSGR